MLVSRCIVLTLLSAAVGTAQGAEGLEGLGALFGALGGAQGQGKGAEGLGDLGALFGALGGSQGQGKGAEGLGDLGSLFGALGGAQGQGKGAQGQAKTASGICSKKELIVPRPLKLLEKGVLVANGCGPKGMQAKEPYGLWRCCNRHDVCFASCGTEAAFCERRYSACMKKRCQAKENKGREHQCNDEAQSFAGLSGMFGGGIHASSMPQVCDCAETPEDATLKRREWIIDLYTRFAPNNPANNETHIDELLEKYKGKEGNLYYELITKYGAAKGFVSFEDVASSFEIEGLGEMPIDRPGADQMPMEGSDELPDPADGSHSEM